MKKIIAGILSIVFSIILFGGASKIFSDKILEKRAHLAATQREIEKIEARQNNVKELEELLGQVESREGDIENAFVDERTVVRVIEAFEEQARLLGVDLEVESASLPTSSLVQGPEIQLHLEGSFDALFRYMRVLEVLPYQLSFSIVNFDKNADAGNTESRWSGIVRITILSFIPTS